MCIQITTLLSLYIAYIYILLDQEGVKLVNRESNRWRTQVIDQIWTKKSIQMRRLFFILT